MKHLLVLLGLVLASDGMATPPILRHPQKDLIYSSLQRLVNAHTENADHHFFFLRTQNGKGWIYWREGALLWETILDPYYEKKGAGEIRARAVWDLRLISPWKPIDLQTDVATSKEQLTERPFLSTKEFVADVIFDCVTKGELVEMHPQK